MDITSIPIKLEGNPLMLDTFIKVCSVMYGAE